jgi:thiol-disulfide isomerase/thioredoxin
MRRWFMLLFLSSACSAAVKPAPRVAAQTFDGASIEVGGPDERPKLIVFWATWCAVCRHEMPKLVALHNERHDSLRIIGVNVDTDVDHARRFVSDAGLPYPNVSDPKLVIADAYGASATPTLVLVDKNGTEVERSNALEPVMDALRELPP